MSRDWLYQLSANAWSEGWYRESVWEGGVVRWPIGRVAGDELPVPGDRVYLWYARTVSRTPGLYGWGVVLGLLEDDAVLSWRPTYPSDLLKMDPVFDDGLDELISSLRGRFPQGTMWPIPSGSATDLGRRIREWLAGQASP